VAAAHIDHVILAVRDLDEAARRLLADFGLGSVFGGRHEGWGTGNVIVPLGSSYVELIGVVDETEAAHSDLGRRVLARVEEGDRLLGWCVRIEPLQKAADRLELAVSEGSRLRPDGTTLRWRMAGLADAMADPSRPFFISWLVPKALHPGRTTVYHPAAPRDLAWVEVSGDEATIRRWLGPDAGSLPVRIRPGSQALVAAGISTASGNEIVLR